MRRLNDAIFLQTPHAILLPLGFYLVTLSYSFHTIDFNHTKDLFLSFTLIGLGGTCILRPLRTITIPKPLCALILIFIILISFHLTPLSPAITTYTLRSAQHYSLILLYLCFFFTIIPHTHWQKTIRKLILTSAFILSLLAWGQYLRLLPHLFPSFNHYPQPMYSVFGNQNLLAAYIAIAIPILLHPLLRRSTLHKPTSALLLLLITTCAITGSRSACLAAFIGSLCAIPYRTIKKQHGILLLAILLCAITLILLQPDPTLHRITQTFSTGDTGFHVRGWIWTAALAIPSDYPIMGIGPGNFQYLSPHYLGQALHTPTGVNLFSNQLHTLQAHSTPLDLILEFGIAGWVLCLASAYQLLKHRTAITWGGGIAFSVYALLNTLTMSTPHLLIGLLILMTLSNLPPSELPLTRNTSRYTALAITMLIIAPLSIYYTHTTYTPSRQLAQARQNFINSSQTSDTEAIYQQASTHPWAFAKTHAEYGFLLSQSDPHQAQLHFEKALKTLDTGDLHFALSQAYLQQGNPQKAALHAEKGLFRWPRYTPGWQLWLNATPPHEHAPILEQSSKWLQPEQFDTLKNNLIQPPSQATTR